MKKTFLLVLCMLITSLALFGSFGVSAVTTNKTGSYILSKTDQTEKKWTKTVSVSSGKGIIIAQHWKGSTFPTYSDTAYSKIADSSGFTFTKVKVEIYDKNGVKVAEGDDDLYVNKEAGYAVAVGKTKHTFTLKKGSNELIYKVAGTQS